jgi:hypothetical protein
MSEGQWYIYFTLVNDLLCTPKDSAAPSILARILLKKKLKCGLRFAKNNTISVITGSKIFLAEATMVLL